MTDPSSRQRERPTSTNPLLSDSNENLVVSPRRVLYSKTDWPTHRLCPGMGSSYIDWVQLRRLFPEDGDRIQSPKGCFK
jgi:hypothetical protein